MDCQEEQDGNSYNGLACGEVANTTHHHPVPTPNSKLIQNGPNSSKLVQTPLVQSGLNWSKLVQTGPEPWMLFISLCSLFDDFQEEERLF